MNGDLKFTYVYQSWCPTPKPLVAGLSIHPRLIVWMGQDASGVTCGYYWAPVLLYTLTWIEETTGLL